MSVFEFPAQKYKCMVEKISLFYKLKILFSYKKTRRSWQKPVDELTFADDYLFGALMHQKEVCSGVIERLLNMQPMQITYPEIQKTISPFYDTKGIRMDVLANDGKSLYNLEMQTSNYVSLPLRMRFYQGLLDMDLLMKGKDYSDLCHCYVIFICKKDPFGLGMPVYTFCNTCQEKFSLKLNDKSLKIFYNVTAWQTDPNAERSSLLRYISTGAITSPFTKQLDEAAQKIKTMNKFRRAYMMRNIYIDDARKAGIEEGFVRGHEEGLQEGILEGEAREQRKTVISFYKNKVSISIIASSLGKTTTEVKEIIRSELGPVAFEE